MMATTVTSHFEGSGVSLTRIVHTLHPGDVVCAERGDRMETLLGSCVAVVLTDRARTIGAMCHIVHSQPSVIDNGNPTASADAAIDSMYRLLMDRSLSPRLCHAFVYGGGNMFPSLFRGTHVGDSNGQYVLERLAVDGLRVLSHELGGNTYRRLSWTIGDGMPEVKAVAV
jgi:chemotaxis protein CheD